MATLERAGNSNPLLLAQHLARYHFATGYLSNGLVLDLGCGEAFGTQILLGTGAEIAALDISPEATHLAREKSVHRVVRADARAIPYRTDTFDSIVSFEVFEHIPEVERYLSEAHRILKNSGVFFVSTPNVEYYPLAGMNPFHVKEYSYDEVFALLKNAGFRVKTCFAQEAAGVAAAKLEGSALLLSIMKFKRRFGFHGDLLPHSLQKIFRRIISGTSVEKFSPEDFVFIEHKSNSAELIYIAEAIKI